MNKPNQITIATWNVNSIKARLQHCLDWLEQRPVDVMLLQEIKCETLNFPSEMFEERGYNVTAHGQKSYNGVAILSKYPMNDVITSLPGDEADEQARYLEAVLSVGSQAVRVSSIYVPNGQSVDSDKFQYKLRFFERLYGHSTHLLSHQEILILGGDYNVAPEPMDVYDAPKLDGTVCYHPKEREALRALLYSGLYDAYRAKHPQQQHFSWWDYRGGSFPKNKGLRIDHLLCSPQAMDHLQDCVIDDTPRHWDKPSDHAPVVATLSL